MKTSALRRLYQIQNNESWEDAADRVYHALPQGVPRDNEAWTAALAVLVQNIDFKDQSFINDVAAALQKVEQKKRTLKAPGEDDQLELDLCTRDWAENQIIALPEEQTVAVIDATPQHWAIAVGEREDNLRNAANSLNRTKELAAIASEPGGLVAAMKRRGVAGW